MMATAAAMIPIVARISPIATVAAVALDFVARISPAAT
jgi:hypothetical protein